MKLFYFQGENGVSNFGDELNQYVWPRLLPGAFDDDGDTQFVGIGTLLNDRLPLAPRTVVFGTGVGYYGLPRQHHAWSIYCVRGPRSARALGLRADAAITDPAALIARLKPHRGTTGPRWKHAFMPHWQSQPDAWKRVCAALGMGFVDPRSPPDDVLDAIGRTDVLIAEAMHGAIVADALRVPWIPVRSCETIKAFKWEDWCESLGLEYRAHPLPTIWPEVPGVGVLRRLRRVGKFTLAARALATLAKRVRPVLSREDVLQDRLQRLEARLEQLRSRELARCPVGLPSGTSEAARAGTPPRKAARTISDLRA